MKRIFLNALLLVFLLVALVSCDEALSLMKKMGNNVTGADPEKVTQAVDDAKKTEKSEETVIDKGGKIGTTENVEAGKKFTYTDGSGKQTELYSVGKSTDKDGAVTNVIGIGDYSIEIKQQEGGGKLEEVNSVLAPKDISIIVDALDGSGSDETLLKLSEKIEDETTKEAAEGTKTVMQVLLEEAQNKLPKADDKDISEDVKTAVNTVNTIVENIRKKEDMTVGDVVVLQAVTNIISEAPDIIEMINGEEKEGESASDKIDRLLDEANDTIFDTITVLNTVPEATTIFKGIDFSSMITTLLNMSGSGSGEKKEG